MNRGERISGIFNRLLVIFFAPALMVACDKSYTRPHPTSIPNYDVKYSGIFERANANDSSDVYGTVTANFNTLSGLLEYNISWHLLSSLPVSIHVNDAGPVIFEIFNFPARISADYSGSKGLTGNQTNDLAHGYISLTILTQKYPAGEITATLTEKRQ